MEIDGLEMQEIDNIFNDAYKKTTTLREAWRYAMMRYAEIYHDREVKKLNEPAVSKSEGFEREPAVCPKCGNTGRCEPRTLSDPDGQECDCGAN